MTTATMDLVRVARHLISLYHQELDATRPIDRRLAGARFGGACSALYAAGFGLTPEAVRFAVTDGVKAAGTCPPYEASRNTARKAFLTAAADDVARRLREL